MNENPGGTPNPLNPNQTAAPAGPAPRPGSAQPEVPVPPVAPPQPVRQTEPVPAPAPASPTPTQPTINTMASSRLTEVPPELVAKSSAVEPQKKSKTGLVVALVFLFLLVAGGAAAAIYFLKPFGNKDAVPAAIAKLFSDSRQKIVSMSGTITSNNADTTTLSSTTPTSWSITFDSAINTVSAEQYVNADITATFSNESSIQFNANEIHTANNDLYLKLSGVADTLENYQSANLNDATNCFGDPDMNCDDLDCLDAEGNPVAGYDCISPQQESAISSFSQFTRIFEAIDNQWVHIPSTTFSNLGLMSSGSTQCLIDAAGNLGKYGSDFDTMYKNNPFITYSTDNLAIKQKKNQLYLLNFDADQLAGFINSMSTSGFMNELISCMGGAAINREVTADDLQNMLAELPTIYVEIDDQNNFTRTYLTMNNDGMTITADLSFTYPTSIVIEEPETYVEINTVLSQLYSGFYGEDDFYDGYDYYDEIEIEPQLETETEVEEVETIQ